MDSFKQKKNHNKLVETTLANWRTSPNCKWAFHHVREIVPSAEIQKDSQTFWKLESQAAPFDTTPLTSLINTTSTDGVVIIHQNKIIFESYKNGMNSDDQHILFSVSKSILGLVAGCLIRDNIINEQDLITNHLPEMLGTAYENATIRDALDMRVGVYFDENYTSQQGAIIDYRYAANWNPTPESKLTLNLKSFLASLKQRQGLHSDNFKYVSPNTDLLAWVFERTSGRRYAELISDYLWKPIGAERSAYITVDRIGAMRAAGGVCMTPRDLGRLGLLVAQNGWRDGKEIIPSKWIEDLYENGDTNAWNNGSFKDFFTNKDRHYRSKWYVCQENGQLLHGFGIHGQYLFIDRERKLSISWLSSESDPLNMDISHKILEMINKLRIEL
jgi:hypothetical protein